MEKNKRSIILKQIVWGIAVIAPGIYLAYRGIVKINFLMIFASISLFVIGVGFLRVAIYVMKGAKFLSNDELDAGFAEIRSHISETLLPLGFEEVLEDFYTTYKRGERTVQLANDKRDQQFSLLLATKSKSLSRAGRALDVPDFEISVMFPFNDLEGFRMSAHEKLHQWLKEQNFK